MIAFIEGGMKIPMGRVTRDLLINYRLFLTQCSPNLFRVLGSIDMINRKMGTNLTWNDVNWVYNCQKGKKADYYFKCRVSTVRLISCIPESNKGMDKDFLIVSGDWHDGLHTVLPKMRNQVGFPQIFRLTQGIHFFFFF